VKLLASLTNRIFLASSLLAVISIAVAVYVVNARVTRDAESSLRRGLDEAAALLGDWEATLSDNFKLASRLIADSPKLKAAIDTGDPQTVERLAPEFFRLTRADLLIITDRQGRQLSVLGPWPADAPPPQPAPDAGEGVATISYWPRADGVLQVVTVPVLVGPQMLGSVSVGFLFDVRRAGQLRQMTESEIAFAVRGRVCAATVAPEYFPLLARMLQRGGMWQAEIGGDEYVGLARPLVAGKTPQPGFGPAGQGPPPEAPGGAAAARTVAAGDAPAAIVFQSRTERLRFLRQIHTALAITALLAVIGAVVLSYMVARTVTRPLAAITAGMREMARTGDLTRKLTLPAGQWVDEDARLLASTFNTLTDSIATFQREAAQRERLSSLGRLSTIIAHEIRNPLMIIKGSVRALRREPLAPDEVREAAGDIGEEVERLNRIVAGVLDFARPIRFEHAPTDLRALCEQSVAAATADGPKPAIRFSGPPGPLVLTTDGERLRGVLVNLITNARHAVLARGETGETAPVEVRLASVDPRRAVMEVSDRGSGIPEAQLSRIFEPYFTTKRGGTGLGLAIARNVIDGLGGSISVESTEGVGTTVRIELPEAAADAK
jgi:signal transduction histidine kinase